MAQRTGANSADLWGNTKKDGTGNDYQVLLDDDGKVKVSLDSDVQIGAVEIKNHNTDDRAEVDTNNAIKTKLSAGGNDVDAQNPLPTDGDSVYAKDIDTANSSIGDFSGAVTDLFDSLTSTIVATADNPSLSIKLNRPIDNHTVIISTPSGNFSNATIVAKDSSGATLETIDDSADSTNLTTKAYHFTTIDQWCELAISFTTTDTVTLGDVHIHKGTHVDAHIHAFKPDGTVTAIDATAGGNLKVSVEEFETAANPIRTDLEGNGYVTIGTTQVELTYTGTTNTIHLESKDSNTGTIWIGKTGVTNSGGNSLASILPGQSLDIKYDDATNALYAISDTAGQSLLKGALL